MDQLNSESEYVDVFKEQHLQSHHILDPVLSRFLGTLACHVTRARMAAEVPRCFYSTVGSHAGTALVLSHCECATRLVQDGLVLT